MGQLVTVTRIRALYDAFCSLPPFHRWSMPPGRDVRFKLCSDLGHIAVYNTEKGKHVIEVNPHLVHTFSEFAMAILHEMAHLRQEVVGKRPGSLDEQHNREFYRLKRLICRDLGLDPERF